MGRGSFLPNALWYIASYNNTGVMSCYVSKNRIAWPFPFCGNVLRVPGNQGNHNYACRNF